VPEPTSTVAGVIALDENGKIVLATGICEDPRFRAFVSDDAWMEETRQRRLRALMLNRIPYALLLIAHESCEILLVNHAPGNALFDFLSSVDFAYDIFQHLVSDPFEGMTVIDKDGKVAFISPVHEEFFNINRGGAVGRPVRDVIENTRLDRVLKTGKAEIGRLQKLRNIERVVTRIPIRRGDKIIGAVGRVMFKEPRQIEELAKRVNALESEVQFYRREATALRRNTYGLESLIGESLAMQRLRAQIMKVAPLEIPVLIRGESGTGKELVAHAIHQLSPRRDAQMVMVNSAALPANLVETELFGYEPGAFTGADRKGRAGKFEMADNSSIFLDEIGDMPLEIQVKLLRVLQDRNVERIGGGNAREVSFRLITATNRDLRQMISEDKFRLDLYYRISAIVIDVPPLRQRIEEIPALTHHILEELTTRHKRAMPTVTEDALEYLMDQRWPGNVRQLRHEIERAVVFCEDNRIDAATLSHYGELDSPLDLELDEPRQPPSILRDGETRQMKDVVEKVEHELVMQAMERFKGNKKRVAEELGISRTYLYKILGDSAG
jgi:transcriptional regulator with PAS, ATPase and Fis domain